MASDRDRMIEDRAYQIWVEGGRQDGTADQNWEQAVRDVAAGWGAAPDEPPHDAPKAAKRGATTKAAPKESAAKKAKSAKAESPKATKNAASTGKKGDKGDKAKTGTSKPRAKP